MLALRVSVNGAKPVTGGFSGPHVLSAIVSSVLRDPEAKRSSPEGQPLAERELKLTLGGLDTAVREHVDWATVELAVGDKIVLEVLELGSVDPPARRSAGKGEGAAAAKPVKAPKAAQLPKPGPAAPPAKAAKAAKASATVKQSGKAPAGKRKRRP